MGQPKNKSSVDRVWDFLASVKLAIVIFALISLTSIVGTVLEQRAQPAVNIQILGKLFGESAAPGLYRVFHALGFMDMYHSWWFTALLVIFSVNLIICSLDRLPRIWKLIREPVGPMTEERLRKFPMSREAVLKGSPDRVRDTVMKAIRGSGFRYTEVREEKGYQFYAQRGNYTRLGVYVTHFSILVILTGAIIGIRLGFGGYLNLPEGAVSTVAFSRTGEDIPLGFGIRCDRFDVEFYGNSDMPKEYRSWLTIIKDGKEVLTKSIVVNDPLTYDGITFYQASYGLINENIDKGIFMFRVISRNGQAENLNLRWGDSFQIPGTDMTARIVNFSPALRLGSNGEPFTYSDQMNNPAVFIVFSEGGKQKYSGWIMKRYPQTWQLPDGNRIEFLDYWGVQYTGLQVRKDPGVWVVYFGCIAISIGLFIAFFMSHRKIWVKVTEEKNNSRVVIGATCNKNRASLEKKIDGIISVLSKKQEGQK